MSVAVVVRPSAAQDLAEAHAYYAAYDKGKAFVAAVDRALVQIEELPLAHPIVYADVRRALLRRFPYAIFFIVEGDRAVILAVHHQRRDPAARPAR